MRCALQGRQWCWRWEGTKENGKRANEWCYQSLCNRPRAGSSASVRRVTRVRRKSGGCTMLRRANTNVTSGYRRPDENKNGGWALQRVVARIGNTRHQHQVGVVTTPVREAMRELFNEWKAAIGARAGVECFVRFVAVRQRWARWRRDEQRTAEMKAEGTRAGRGEMSEQCCKRLRPYPRSGRVARRPAAAIA